MDKGIRSCSKCKYRINCNQYIEFMDCMGQIYSRKELEYCSEFYPEYKAVFQSKFSQYVALKNLDEPDILELARVISDDNKELFIFSIENSLIDLEEELLEDILKEIFLNESYIMIKENQFEQEIEKYTIIERIKF